MVNEKRHPIAIAFAVSVVGNVGEEAACELTTLNLDDRPVRTAFIIAGLTTVVAGVTIIAVVLAMVGGWWHVARSLAGAPIRGTGAILHRIKERISTWRAKR